MSRSSYFVRRTIRAGSNMTLELCVPLATAVRWTPELEGNEPMLRAAAEGRAIREATGLINTRGTTPGRWRVVWTGTDPLLELIP
jgi:hypothetical protein